MKELGLTQLAHNRRMGVALAKGINVQEAREKATRAASKIKIV